MEKHTEIQRSIAARSFYPSGRIMSQEDAGGLEVCAEAWPRCDWKSASLVRHVGNPVNKRKH